MHREPIFCENFLERIDAWRHILDPNPQQQRVLGVVRSM
jgi:hypothetical protein